MGPGYAKARKSGCLTDGIVLGRLDVHKEDRASKQVSQIGLDGAWTVLFIQSFSNSQSVSLGRIELPAMMRRAKGWMRRNETSRSLSWSCQCYK